ncbi:hypothetical protein ACHAXH_000105, partial [Discostella pseudostelligera]
MTIVPGTRASSEPFFQRQGGLIRHHDSRGGEMHQQDNLTPSPSAAGGIIGTPSSSSSSVLTPTMINNEAHFDFIPATQDRRKLPPGPTCLANPANCPACHLTETCCMQQNFDIYGGNSALSCSSQALEVKSITILDIDDPDAYECNCNVGDPTTPCSEAIPPLDCQGKPIGTYFSGCTGNGDTVQVLFKANIEIKNDEYDLALYINTKGGNVKTDPGESCVVQSLSQFDASGSPYPLVVNKDSDSCLDAGGKGLLIDHPFPPLTLNCNDANNDGLLDFSLGVSFSQAEAVNQKCYPGTSSKCWEGSITLAIYVPPPPTNAPTFGPTTKRPTFAPTNAPSFGPTNTPTASPSYSPTNAPTKSPSYSPTNAPTFAPTDTPTASPSYSPTNAPTFSPTNTPTASPSYSPTNAPTDTPTASPSYSPTNAP